VHLTNSDKPTSKDWKYYMSEQHRYTGLYQRLTQHANSMISPSGKCTTQETRNLEGWVRKERNDTLPHHGGLELKVAMSVTKSCAESLHHRILHSLICSDLAFWHLIYLTCCWIQAVSEISSDQMVLVL
jgi:hypothetical protein